MTERAGRLSGAAGFVAGPRPVPDPGAAGEPRTVPALLARQAAVRPGRLALATYGGEALTFRDWDERATAVAWGLLDRGLERGQRVALVYGIADWVDFAIGYCAVQRAGGVAVPCPDGLTPAETRYILDHSQAVAVLHAPRAAAPWAAPYVWSATVAELAPAGGPGPEVRLEVRLEATDPAQILYTSGTTGRPQGVLASHANLTSGGPRHPGSCARHRGSCPRRHRDPGADPVLHVFGVGTDAGQRMLVDVLDAGPPPLALPKFTPSKFARAIEAYQIGSIFVVPPVAIDLLRSEAFARCNAAGVRLCCSTGAPLPLPVAAALARALPNAVILDWYTSIEAAPAWTAARFDPARPGAVGRTLGEDVKIVGRDRTRVPAGQVGDVWLRTPETGSYFRDESATRRTFRDGWIRMGDLGRLDADGYLYLVDRDSDLIRSGSHEVSTLRVEAALHEHPDVVEAAVFGVPHPGLGKAVAAAVVLPDAVPAGEAAAAGIRLRDFLRERLAGHEVPEYVIIVAALPRNTAGGVLKRELVWRFADVAYEREVTVNAGRHRLWYPPRVTLAPATA